MDKVCSMQPKDVHSKNLSIVRSVYQLDENRQKNWQMAEVERLRAYLGVILKWAKSTF